ncbi:sel1 repeat family protein, partial [Neisseria meningitidis]|nr:sel1 repeat family protein [Neisseria meningitidis]
MKQTVKWLAAALIALGLNQAAWAANVPDFRATLQAAERGDTQAQFNLGMMYAEGRGVRQDYAEAVRWTRQAADYRSNDVSRRCESSSERARQDYEGQHLRQHRR